MASIRTSLNLIDNMSRTLDRVTGKTDRMKRSIDSAKRVMNKETRIVYTLDSAGRAQARLAGATDIATKKFEQQDNQVKKNVNSTDALEKKLKKLGKTLGAAYSVKKIIALTDQITATTARLDLMNDGLQTTAELQEKIFQSAQRARGSYLTTASAVSQMGILAADAFASNDEVIAFVEQLNKHFTISGTSTQGIEAAMLQLTQAMGQGVLRGEELNSVFEQAPTIIQSIAKYLGVPIGKIRELAQEGKITSQIVKNAMFATAEETNAKFAQMPMTFGQVTTVIGNTLLQTFEPVLQGLGRGAQWIYDNWSTLEPIFWGLTAAIGAYTVAMGIHKAVTWLVVEANRELIITMLKNPALWVAIAIGILVGKMYQWIKAVGGVKIAWQIAVDKILTIMDWLKIGFTTGGYWILNMLDKMKLGFMIANVAIQNYMDDMNVKVLNILQNMVNGAIGIINKFIGTLNKIPGVSIDAISEVTFATTAKAEIEARKAQRTAELAKYRADIEASIAERDAALRQMKAEARAATAQRQAEIRAAQEAAKEKGLDLNLGDMAKNIAKIADDTGDIKDSVDISQEDLKWMRDLAEQETINRFTTATLAPQISINFTGDIRETADIDGIIGRLEEILTEEINIAAEGVHS
ncbi:tape measure protein [Tepidimicrobium xylanilyticum]|uniref:Tape measure domain-containing protein n=1 Tax=Tepidimicrobium xylanilyticum TaxID=1123352 RepID=A0A1H3EYP4_9FIRM|nr:tape measure protein [Tepidimicrobium xylanilyticum]SDX83178.1 tape measure domain-containing protein [Tepidimicrobium xylanilyticum]